MENAYVLQLNESENQHPELYLCFCGYGECAPGHSFGPAARKGYVLHVILEGEGNFYIDKKTYHLQQGQGFLIEPDARTYYEASTDNPWTYIWIGFDGTKCQDYIKKLGISMSHPIFKTSYGPELKNLITEMLSHSKIGEYHDYFLQGYFFHFLGYLAKELTVELPYKPNEKQTFYIKKAIEYIGNNYVHEITVQNVADFVCINRSYLCTLFKNELGISPQKYLSDFRIDRGRDMLSMSDLSIESIASSCGYKNPLVFSKAFKQKIGMSPRDYRKEIWSNNKKQLESHKENH
ncbi:AraC family transcriptional regulator [Lachnospiraceae bacterium OttesenSCG-928-J05]|nr:AraC family transcriptional regulator [Lachnospiraceae bacterium OttesenSCG-928-J05]